MDLDYNGYHLCIETMLFYFFVAMIQLHCTTNNIIFTLAFICASIGTTFNSSIFNKDSLCRLDNACWLKGLTAFSSCHMLS